MSQSVRPTSPVSLRWVAATAIVALAASVAPAYAAAPGRPVAHPQKAFTGKATGGVINHLKHITMIGSTVDPLNGDVNPYGLVIAPSTSGYITQGDLVICNFNDSYNIQGLGTTIEVLHPAPGSTPRQLTQDGRITGCAAMAMSSDDAPWVAAFTANTNPIISTTGSVLTTLPQWAWTQPWGQIYSPAKGGVFYESGSNDGSITRINLGKKLTFDVIATGFSVNHGVPGTVLAPSGLTYDATNDILYIVDGNANRLVAFSSPGTIPPGGITVSGSGFSGPAAGQASVVYAGSPLSAPISAALLYNGDVVVGNTSNNDLIEISPTQKAVVGMKNLDHHAAGALFGIAAQGTSQADTQIYFNDDNQNAVELLSQ